MATTHDDGDRIALTKLDTRLLVALLRGPMSVYEVSRQAEDDITDPARLSTGAVRPAIRQLERLLLVREVAPEKALRPSSANSRRIYEITSLGIQAVKWEMDTFDRLRVAFVQRLKPKNSSGEESHWVSE